MPADAFSKQHGSHSRNDMNHVPKVSFFAWIVCAMGAVYYCYEYFLRISPSVMTTELMKTYHLTGAEVGSLSAFYYHAYVPMQIAVGLLMDRFGPRRLLTLACFLCAIGTYLFASSESIAVAQLGRFIVGFGSAFAFVGSLKLATIWLPPNRFAFISGIITCLGMIGAMAGDILLQATVHVLGWKETIYVSAVAGLILAFVLWGVIRDVNPDNHRTAHHLINFRNLLRGLWGALKNPQIWLNGLVGFLLYLSLSAFAELWSIPYLTEAHHFSRDQAAHANAMIFLGWAIGGPFWGWFSDYVGLRCVPIILSSIGALLFLSILLYISQLAIPVVYLLLLLFGLTSSVQVLVFAVCREVSSPTIAATAIALTNMIVMIGGNVFQPVIGKLLDLQWNGAMVDGARIYSTSAYKASLTIMPVSIVLAIILVTFFIRETYCKPVFEPSHHPR